MGKLINITTFDDFPEWLGEEHPPSGIYQTPWPNVAHFIVMCYLNPNNKYVLVTTKSDLGICYQKEHPINKDMSEFIELYHKRIASDASKTEGIKSIKIESRCMEEECSMEDIYSIKHYIYTARTCNWETTPDSFRGWFATNANIAEEKLTCVPFGVNDSPEHFAEPVKPFNFEKRDKLLYVNFSPNTLLRKQLLNNYKSLLFPEGVTVYDKKDPDAPGLPFDEYIEHLKTHQFVLCPPGIGFDSFRIWEALYHGAIPVVLDDRWNRWMGVGSLPVYRVNDMMVYKKELITAFRAIDRALPKDAHKYITEEYWLGKINDIYASE